MNYAHLLAARLDLALHDVTFSGATTLDMAGHPGQDRAAQLSAVDAATSLVTLTAGGNDVGYLPGLTLSRLPRGVRAFSGPRGRLAAALDAATLDERFAALDGSLSTLVGRIRDRAPESVVVLVDYLTILPPSDSEAEFVPAVTRSELRVLAWGRDVADRLTETTRAVAERHGARFIAASDASKQHHAWASEPWTRRFHYGLRGGAPYHPTLAGMGGVAELLVDLLASPTTQKRP